ncbi:MAG: hypothetical protein DRP16_00425 [Candidatus Aenigmatarchaeota archaeon]|nr:MAG: hypothetical protein DRP16_00425 [Candidatus Aenigmarchaeota archaeon]
MKEHEIELIIDCKNVSRETYMNDEKIYNVLVKAAELIGMRILATAGYNSLDTSPPRAICFVMVDESFLYCHSYADEGFMSIRVFACGTADAYKGWEYIKKEPNVTDFKIKEFKLIYEQN